MSAGTHLAPAGFLLPQTPPAPALVRGGGGARVPRWPGMGDKLALPGDRGSAQRCARGRAAGRWSWGRRGLTCLSSPLLALAPSPPLPSRRPPHPQEALPLFEIPDPGTGARVFLQRVYQQRKAAAAVADAEPDGPTSENLVSEQKDERKKTKQRPAAVFLGKSSAVTADRALWGEGGKGEIILFYFYFLFSNSPSFRGWKTGLWPGLAPTAVARTSFRNLLHLGLTQCGTGTGPGKGGEGECLIHGEWTPLAPRPRIFI